MAYRLTVTSYEVHLIWRHAMFLKNGQRGFGEYLADLAVKGAYFFGVNSRISTCVEYTAA